MQSQVEAIEAASAARTTTLTGPDRFNDSYAEILEVVLDMTTFVTAASLTLSIDAWDAAKGGYYQLIASTVLSANGQKRLIVGPSVPTAANISQTAIVPMRYRVVVTHGNGNSHTYSVSRALRGSPN